MSTPVSVVGWENSLNSGVTTTTTADLPIFTADSDVFLLSSEPAVASNLTNTPRYRVNAVVCIPLVSGGASVLGDQTLLFANPADGSTARAMPGFQHTGSPSGTYGATTTSRQWFYDITPSAGGVATRRVHQSQLTDAAGWEAYLATKLAGIIA